MKFEDYVFFTLLCLVLVVVLSLIGMAVYYEINHPTLYTVRHGDSVHYRASINIYTHTGIVEGTDSDGRRFIYRDGWEAIQEPAK